MKWLKHQTDSRNDLDMQTILQEFGAVGYGIFWMCLELVASQGENYQVKKSKNWLKHVSNLSKIDQEETEVILNKFAELGMINKKSLSRGNLHVPKMAKYADEYTHKKKKTGDFVLLEEKRRDKEEKRIEENNTMSEKSDAPSSFDTFWNSYPKKELKKKSQEIWKRKKLDSHLEEILAFIEKAKTTDRWKKGFVKQPPVFLNNESWTDDLSAYGDKSSPPEQSYIDHGWNSSKETYEDYQKRIKR